MDSLAASNVAACVDGKRHKFTLQANRSALGNDLFFWKLRFSGDA